MGVTRELFVDPPMEGGMSLICGLRTRFLWKATETIIDPKEEETIGEDAEVIWPAVKVFKWTGMNDYVALCEKDSVSFGGGYETLCFCVVKDFTY